MIHAIPLRDAPVQRPAPVIRPLFYLDPISPVRPVAWVECDQALMRGTDNVKTARNLAALANAGGIWRHSRRRAFVEAMNALRWPGCTLVRGDEQPWIYVQIALDGDNLPTLADILMDGDQRALHDLLDRMDEFHLSGCGWYLSFRFPAHWAPSAMGDGVRLCPDCRNTGVMDFAWLGIDPCECRRAAMVYTGPQMPRADIRMDVAPCHG